MGKPWSRRSAIDKFRVPALLAAILAAGLTYTTYFRSLHSERIDRKMISTVGSETRMERELEEFERFKKSQKE